MSFFAVTYTYVDDAQALDAVRPRHREFLGQLAGRGTVVASGPLAETTPARALILMRADSADEVRTVLASDPFQVNQLVADTEVLAWQPVIGQFASQL